VRRLLSETGQASVELMGMLWLLFLVALAVWQLLLATWAAEQAQNAARTGSRVEGRGGDAGKAARNAVTSALRKGMDVDVGAEEVTVSVRIPILIPGLVVEDEHLLATRHATLPSTGGTT
jgi:TadE-like protein